MLAAALLLVAAAPPEPPALLDPLGAAAYARVEVEAPRARAEALLLTGDPEQARAGLARGSEDPRTVRLIADSFVAQARAREGELALAALESHPGWEKHARQQRARLGRRVWARHGARIGLALFAVCLAVLGLAGARELLRVHPETVAVLALVGGSALLARGAGPTAGLVAALVGASVLLLGHGAVAASRRIRPGPRGRLFLVTLLVFGVAGAVGALVFQVGVDPLIGGLVAGARGTSG